MSLLHPARRDPFYLFQRLLKLLCPTDASFEHLLYCCLKIISKSLQLLQVFLQLLCPSHSGLECLHQSIQKPGLHIRRVAWLRQRPLHKLSHVSSGHLCKAELISWGWGGWIAISAGFFMAFVL